MNSDKKAYKLFSLKYLAYLFVFFFFFYDCFFSQVNYSTNSILGYVGIVIFFVFNIKTKVIKMTKRDFYCLFLFFIMIFWAIMVLFFNNSLDLTFIRNEIIRNIVFPFFSSFLVAWLGRKIIKDISDYHRIILLVSVIQCIIILCCFVLPEFKEYIISIQTISAREILSLESGIRSVGLGTRFDFGSFTMSVALFSTSYLYLTTTSSKEKNILIIIYILQVISGLFLARSISIGLIISLIFILIFDRKIIKKIRFIFFASIIVLIIVFSILIIFPEFITKYSDTFKWMFQYIPNNNTYSANSPNTLKTIFEDMYFLPEHFKTWLIGDGIFSNSIGNAYKGTDPLYMRYILYWGIPGLTVFIGFLSSCVIKLRSNGMHCFVDIKDEKVYRKYLLLMFLLCCTVYVKLNYHFFKILFLIGWFIYFKQKSIKQ